MTVLLYILLKKYKYFNIFYIGKYSYFNSLFSHLYHYFNTHYFVKQSGKRYISHFYILVKILILVNRTLLNHILLFYLFGHSSYGFFLLISNETFFIQLTEYPLRYRRDHLFLPYSATIIQ